VSDIEYLATIESGKGPGNSVLKTDEGSVTATGDIASITASASTDLYVARAKCSARLETDSASQKVGQVELKVNGVIKETFSFSLSGSNVGNSGGSTTTNYEFECVGLKVDATQIIKLEFVTDPTGVTVDAFLECIEIDDGVSPRLP